MISILQACLGVQLHVIEILLPELLSVTATPPGQREEGEEGGGRCPTELILAPVFSLLARTTK